jgi:hypothetical protein
MVFTTFGTKHPTRVCRAALVLELSAAHGAERGDGDVR